MLLSLGLTAGLICLRLLTLVLGCAYLSALGLLLAGHGWLAVLILLTGHLLQGGLRCLLFGRR
jgi:hypothetical protein